MPHPEVVKAIAEGKSQKHPGGNIEDRRSRIGEGTVHARIRVSPEAPESAQQYNDDARQRVMKGIQEINKTWSDRDLSIQGREKAAKDAALRAMKGLDKTPHALLAYESISERQKELESILAAERKPPSNQHELMLAADIRAHVRSLPERERAKWADQHRGNPAVARAILTASDAPFLFGMTADQVERFEDRARQALHPEEYREAALLVRTVDELKRSTGAAYELLADAAGLRKARDGETWLSESEKDTTPSPFAAAARAAAEN